MASKPRRGYLAPPISEKIRTKHPVSDLPSAPLDVVAQPFAGSPINKTVTKKTEVKNSKMPEAKKERKAEKTAETTAETTDTEPKKLLKHVNPHALHRREYPGRLTSLKPLLIQYTVDQEKIEGKNPYMTNTEIYTPQSRKSFYQFVNDNYSPFRLNHSVKGVVDPNACLKLETSADSEIESFLYQKFVREYIKNASPYRGVLVYHGLGSGKTCSAIAAAEALYGVSGKKIIVMTPFSLRANFMSEISFCGFKHFNINNHWVPQPIEERDDMIWMYATSILSLKEDFLNKVLRREEDRRMIWIPDFSKRSNYNDLSAEERDDIRAQLNVMIDSRITFISYNGISAKKLREYACTVDPVTGERFFDNAIIVIDEIHNVTRLMRGSVIPYMVHRKGRPRKIPVEPVVPGKWVPGLCGSDQNYNRAYLFYKLLTDARNSKIIGLSGTPIINFPEELGLLANVLAGYTECIEVPLLSIDERVIATFKQIVEKQPRVDIVRFKIVNQQREVLISILNEGYERVVDPKNEEHFIGVRYNKDAQDGVREVFAKIKEDLKRYPSIKLGEERYVSYPRLPIDDETFRAEFIDPKTYEISKLNRLVLQKRITGLISYYAGSKQEYMPRILHDTPVPCHMSDYTLSQYTVARKEEIEGEMKKEKETGDIFATVELLSSMKAPSSYRFRSRAMCNFTFPEEIPRPFPRSAIELEDAVEDSTDNLDTLVQSGEITEEDHKEILEVEQEEAHAVNPEEDADATATAATAATVAEPIAVAEPVAPIAPVDDGKEEATESELEERAAINAVNTLLGKELLSMKPSQASFKGGVNPDSDPNAIKIVSCKAILQEKLGDELDLTSEESIRKALEGWLEDPNNIYIGSKVIEGKKIYKKSSLWANQFDDLSTYKEFIELKIANPDDYPGFKEQLMGLKGKTWGCWEMENCHGEILKKIITDLDAPKKVKSKRSKLVAEPESVKPLESITSAVKSAVKSAIKLITPDKVDEVESKEELPQYISYKDAIKQAMNKLEKKGKLFMQLKPEIDNKTGKPLNNAKPLSEYSQKLHEMLTTITHPESKGSHLVYSQFKTVEGLGVLGIALKINGFVEIKIEGSDDAPRFSEETITSLSKGPGAKEKRFITFTGEGSKERRNLVLNIFNGFFNKLPTAMKDLLEDSGYGKDKNQKGDICWVIGITGAGAEGISLKCCRYVHIMEPYWNNVRLEQVKGRAIRICSHKDLPYAERTVEIYTYYTVFSPVHRAENKIDRLIAERDKYETSDENVLNVSKRKDAINNNIIDIMKESAVDCNLNAADNNGVRCFIIEGRPDKYIFDPNLEVDKIVTSMEFKQQAKTSNVKEEVKVFSYKGVNYISNPKPDSGNLIYYLYKIDDIKFTQPLFLIEINPSTGNIDGSVPIPL